MPMENHSTYSVGSEQGTYLGDCGQKKGFTQSIEINKNQCHKNRGREITGCFQ
jgi:hypothetical protein